jgi:15-cis-phytoene synthase
VSAEACAELVRRGDPDRWRTAMLAPVAKRPGLMALYAFNLEIARAPWVTREAMLAEIRLRWWADAVAEIGAGLPPRRHEVVGPLAEAIRGSGLPAGLFDEMIAARLHDAQGGRFADRRRSRLSRPDGRASDGAGGAASGGGRCGRARGAGFAAGAGRAAYLAAVPAAAGTRAGAAAGRAFRCGDLAREGLPRSPGRGQSGDEVPAEAAPALLAGWRADRVLRRWRRIRRPTRRVGVPGARGAGLAGASGRW